MFRLFSDDFAPRPKYDRKRRRTTRRAMLPGAPEMLEVRITPATKVWTGAVDSLWSTAGNWQDNSAPQANDDLIFDGAPTNSTSSNDLTAGTVFDSITISASGYTLVGNAVSMNGLLTVGHNTGSSAIRMPVELTNGSATVTGSGDLDWEGVISGTAGLTLNGGGTVTLSGNFANTYTGNTLVNAGTLVLSKVGAVSIPGDLFIGDATGTDMVRLQTSDQIADSSSITMYQGGVLNLNGLDDTVGAITMTGASITTGNGVLTLGGNLTSIASTTTSTISGKLDLGGASRTFTVADDTNAVPDLAVSAEISGTGAGIIKNGAGLIEFSGNNTYDGDTLVNAGALQVASNTALGASVPTSKTIVNTNASVYFVGDSLELAETFDLSGTGTSGEGALYVKSGMTTLTGSIGLYANSSMGLAPNSQLLISGGIDDVGAPFNLSFTGGSGSKATLAGNNQFFNSNITANGALLELRSDNALGDPGSTSTTTLEEGSSLILSGILTLPGSKSIALVDSPAPGSPKVMIASGYHTIWGDISFNLDTQFEVLAGAFLILEGEVNAPSMILDKAGPGNLLLNSSMLDINQLTVSGGLVRVNGTLSANSVEVKDGGTLIGIGHISRVDVAAGGTLAPGNSPGILSTGDVSFEEGGIFAVEINGTTVGSQYDQLDVTGTVDLGNATLSLQLRYSPTVGDTYVVINNDGADPISGTFNGLAEGATITVGAARLQISYVGGDGNDMTLTALPLIFTWDGGGSDDNWSTAANWAGDVTPTADSELVFDSGAGRLSNTNDFVSGTVFRAIIILGAGYDLSGNSIQLAEGMTVVANASVIMNIDVAMTADLTFDVANNASLSLQGALSGDFSLSKIGGGRLVLTSANLYSGGTVISEGVFEIQNSHATGVTGTVTLEAGASLLQFSTNYALPEGGLVVDGLGSPATYATPDAQTYTVSGNIQLNTPLNFEMDSIGSLEIRGVISGTNELWAVGSGTLILSGANTYTGATTINRGALLVNGSIASGSQVTVGANTTLGGTGTTPNVIVEADGVVAPGNSPGILTTGNVSFATGSSLALELDGPAAGTGYDQLNVAGTVNLGNATLNASLNFTPTIGDVFRIINNDGSDAVVGTFLNLAQGATFANGATTLQISYIGGDGNDVTLTVTDIVYTWSGAGQSRDWTNPENWTGNLVPTAGSRLVFPNAPTTTESLNNFTSGTAFHSITIAGAGYDIYGNGIMLASGITTTFGSGNSSYELETTLSADQTFSIGIGGTLNFNGVLVDQGHTLTKTSWGTLRLTNTGNEAASSGQIRVSGGTLSIADDDALTSGQVMFNGGFFEVTGSTTIDNPIVLASMATPFTVGNDLVVDFSGDISESGGNRAINKTGGGTMVLSGENSFSGGVNLNSGTIRVADGVNLGSGRFLFNGSGSLVVTASATFDTAIVVDNPGTITIEPSLNPTFTGVISGSSNLTFNLFGMLTLEGTSTHTGAIFVNGGSLVVDGDLSTSSGISLADETFLSGSGVVSNLTSNDRSVIVPGSEAPGVLTTGNLAMMPNSQVWFGVQGTTAGVGYSQIHANGTVTLDDASMAIMLNLTPTLGDVFVLIDNDGTESVVGTFRGLPEGGILYAGATPFRISYVGGDGNDVTATAVAETTLIVTSNALSVTYGDQLTITALVSAAQASPQGTVSFYLGSISESHLLGSGTIDDSGYARFMTTTLDASASPYLIVAEYSGNGAFLGSLGSYDQEVTKALLTVTADPTSREYGQINPQFTATLTGFKNDQTLGTSDVTGSPSLTTTATPSSPVAGNPYVIMAGTGTLDSNNYAFSFVNGELTLTKATTTGSIASSANHSVFGQTVVFTVTVRMADSDLEVPAGQVDFSINGNLVETMELDELGQSTYSTSSLGVGSFVISAVYLGNSNFQGDPSIETVQYVDQASTRALLSLSPNPSAFGQAVTLSVQVSAIAPSEANPTGMVEFFDGESSLGTATLDDHGIATLLVSDLATGSHSISAIYMGSDDFLTSTAPIATQEVGLASTVVTISAPTNSVLGQMVTIVGSVAVVSPGEGMPTGFLSFYSGALLLGSAPLVDGTASFQTSTLGVNAQMLTVRYSGDSQYLASTSSPSLLTVSQALSTTVLTASAPSSVYGQSVTYTAMVNVIPNFGLPTGTVTFYDGTTIVGVAAVAGSSANLTLNNFNVGMHPIVAVYSGDAQFSAAQSNASWQTVSPASTATIFLASPNPAVHGQMTTFTALVSPLTGAPMPPNGSVSFFDGNALIGTANLVGNQATLNAALFGVDQTHSIRAVYSGNANYSSSTSASTTQVLQKANVDGFSEFVPINAASTRYRALVRVAAPGGGVPSGTIVFRINGRGFRRVQLADGQASVRISRRDLARYNFSYRYTGDANYNELAAPDVQKNSSAFAASARPFRAFALRRGR